MRWAVLPGLLAVLVGTADARPGYRIAAEPAWVLAAPVPAAAAPAPDSSLGGIEWVLDDEQQNAVVAPFERYRHLASRVINEQGVDEASQYQISFDPSYQELILHRVRVHRAGQTTDQLDAEHVRVVQRETGFESRVHDGSLTALIVLEDVRPGDVVEVSFTVRGRNPALGDSFEDVIAFGGSWRPGGFRRRILWPAGRPLAVRHVGTDRRPADGTRGGVRELVWAPERPVRVATESDAPDWYVAGPYVEISSHASWNDVARWGSALFRAPAPSPALERLLDGIRAAHGDPHGRALAAIRFVEDDIRYLSNAFGESALRPSDPGRVIARRFGDCKDKVLLLVSLLRGLGLRADPALVSTTLRRRIVERLPGSQLFDHAVVRIVLDGRVYWVDPTRQGQRGGALSRLHVPDYGRALVLDPGETEPAEVRPSPEGMPRWAIRRTFEDTGGDGKARLTVETLYSGGAAEDVRVLVASLGRDELEQNYLSYYQATYPEIARSGPVEIFDEELLNRMRVVESYEITGLWTPTGEGAGKVADLTAVEVREHLNVPARGPRTAPFAVDHPRHIVCETRMITVDGWAIRPESLRVENAALRFLYRASARDDTLTLWHEYETLADSVAAGAVSAYLDDLDRINEALGFHASTGQTTAGGQLSLPLVLVVVACGGAGAVGAVHIHRLRPRRRSRIERFLAGEAVDEEPATETPPWDAPGSAPDARPTPEGSGPDGDLVPGPAPAAMRSDPAYSPGSGATTPPAPQRLGGWLWLLALGAFLGPLFLLYRTLSSLGILNVTLWTAMTGRGGSGLHPLVAPVALFEACANALLLVGSVLVLAQFMARRFTYPRVWIGVATFGLALQGLDLFLSAGIPSLDRAVKFQLAGDCVRTGVSLLVWSLYLARSRRVRATFVR